MNELEIRTEIQEEHASPLDTQPTPQEQKFCKHCGQRIAKDAVICVHCGRQVEELGTKGKEQPNIVITNEGKIGMGILYIFTLGLAGIGVLVDLIVLLFKPNPYYV